MENKIINILMFLLFLSMGNLIAQNGICESGESPSSPDCDGICDPGDSPSGPDCNGVCDSGDSPVGPDCDGVCDFGEPFGSPDCDGICDPGDHPLSVDCSPLPIELSRFIVAQVDDFIQLKWETISETNNERFEIERSIDGDKFTKIGEIKGSGNSIQPLLYTFRDENPVVNISYYRLKQIDFDGQFTFSEIQRSNFKPTNRVIDLYPNPSQSGIVSLKYVSNIEERVEVNIYDITGKLLDQELYYMASGVNVIPLDYSNLFNGIYTVLIKTNSVTKHRKLIIN